MNTDDVISTEISIIVPVYNVEKYLYRCVNSILSQTYKHFEVVLVDDGSPDNCGSMCDEIAQKWNLKHESSKVIVIHQKNAGLSAARNAGIDWVFRNSNSKWITFIDSDDWIHPDYLKLLHRAVEQTGNNVAVASHIKISHSKGLVYDESAKEIKICEYDTEDYWVFDRTNATTAWGKLYFRELFKEVRYPLGKYHEDEYVTYRILFQQRKIAVIQFPLYYYYNNEEGISRMSYMKRFLDIKEALYEHYEFFKTSKYTKAFQLECAKYAEVLADAIFLQKKDAAYSENQISEVREELKGILEENKSSLPYYKNKAIYIAAYPEHEIFIRVFGFILGKRKSRKKNNI